jgi:iron complex transport system substrate-binding protein
LKAMTRMFSRLLLLTLLFVSQSVQAAPPRTLIDMAGDTVTLPARVERIATVGPVPVLNSLVFAIGEGRAIVNGLPEFARKPRWGYQAVFAPHTANLPPLDNPDRTPNLEALLRAAPDVVLTMDRASAEALRRAGLPALYLAWRQPEDVKATVRLLGQVFAKPKAAERYAERFDAILADVDARLRGRDMPPPSVLYFSPKTLSQPHLVVEWWIRVAGGNSLTDDGRKVESRSFTLEQLLAWDPDILIVAGREEADTVLQEPRFNGLKAVRGGRVLVAPCGAHTWGNRSAEQALTVLWAAKHLHPTLFADVDLADETQRFYHDIFGVSLSRAQVEEILAGGPRSTQLVQ